jgi:hypothetical protein
MGSLLLTLLLLLQGTPATSTTVSGRLLPAANTSAANVRVALTPVDDPETLVAFAQTDREGRFRIENVPAGAYYLVAGAVSSPTYFPDATSPGKAISIDVRTNAPLVVPDFRLLPISGPRLYPVSGNLRFAGRVIFEGVPDGTTPPPLTLQLHLLRAAGEQGVTDRRLVFSATIPVDGSFEIRSLVPGQYSVSFIPGDNAPAQRLVLEKDIGDWKFSIPLRAPETTR